MFSEGGRQVQERGELGRLFYMHQQHGICIPAVLHFLSGFHKRACTHKIEMTSATHVRTGR